MIGTGMPFPNFSLQNQDGAVVTLKNFTGKWLVVYVYPKDDTPGCTIQGKSFTASRADFQAANIEIVGVSQDDVSSHKDFCNKFAFTIDLLADPKAELLKAAGVEFVQDPNSEDGLILATLKDPEGNLVQLYQYLPDPM